eukprot:gb/GFBE01052849.1/.p1 GENE.gb/GFBE01052849.1/~~gb/GFBE01052849.1/.p1  ORF type:complete len:536 (+),score=127.11 gb/GFBE01052849.1/:1-1608(+)
MAAGARCKADVTSVGRSVAAWRETWRQLALQAWSAESDARRDLQTQGQRSLSQEHAAELRACWESCEQERQVWEQDVWSGLGQLRKRVAVLGANLRFAPSADDLRSMVGAVEHKLQLYNEQARQQFDELAAQECSLVESLEASLTRFEGWCSQESALKATSCTRATSSTALRRKSEVPTSASCSRLGSAGARSRPSSASGSRVVGSSGDAEPGLAEIRERLDVLASKLDSGGATGGWPSDDHEAFMRLLNGKFKRRATPEFLLEAERSLPHLSHEALVAHAKWLADHEKYQAERRQLLEQWRGLKEASRPRTASEAPAGQRSSAQEAQDERRKRAEVKKQELLQLEERRRAVEDWKKQKEEQKELEERQQRAQREAQAQEARSKQALLEKKKQELEAFRRQRQEDEAREREAAQAAKAAGRRLSVQDRERIAERNEALLRHREQHRRQLEERRSSASQAFEPTARATSAAYGHVQSKLHGHTDSYVERARELQEAEEAQKAAAVSKYSIVPGNFAHQGIMRTVRSSPSWRQGFGS